MATHGLEATAEVAVDEARAKLVQALATGEISCTKPIIIDEAERLRMQELLRYFHPQHNPPVGVMGKARVATDSTLTAFAQLSALRLDCQRSYISIMTSNHQYIIAEGTRTISVKSEDVYDGPDDAMYVGQVCVAFKDGLCPGTLATFTAKDNSMDVYDEWLKRSRSYYVMNDMSMLKDYKDRPYIAGWPYMKYYAEVPIHTPSGFTLGSLCVIDNRRKEGLDVKGLAILEEISDCIMDHLELSTCRIQRNNAERMIQALGQFVEGKPSVRQWWMEAQASRGVEPGLKHLSIEKRAEIELGTSRGGHPTTGNVVDLEKLLEPPKLSSEIEILDVFQENASHRRDSGFESTTSETLLLPDASVEGSIKGSSSATTAPSSNSAQGLTSSNDAFSGGDSVSDKKLAPHSQSQLEGMLSRATNLIREGIGLDGVSFFDPRSSDGLLLTEQTPVSQQGSWSDKRQGIRQTSTPLHPVHTAPSAIYQSQECLEKYSRIMASSTREHPYPDPLGPQTMHLPESTLGDIMKLFPRGGTLLYDEKGFISGSDSVFTWASTTSQFIDNSIKSTSTEHSVAANQLRQFLSGATSVLLFPLWDTERDKWFAYSMAWTTDSNRVIQLQDCAYLASFGNSIIAELSRFETIAADQAKGTFISSISHELRSPLHGIMASLELLRETNSDPISIDMINTVESCGSTLLETLDNLLTFAKINRASATEAAIAGTAQDHASLPRVDLGSLVEEITQMCMVGHNFRQTVEKSNIGAILDSPGAGRNPTVTVICDIAPGDEWVFNTGAGIWKRVLMNLLGNSLKYTTSGYIHVKLRREENISESSAIITDEAQKLQLVPSSRSSAVILSVEDSGRGISQDYLTHHLFKPFYQEDPMNPGNGLGLSIVSQLVSSINGFTNVTSELGVGTNVKVSAVLNQDLGGNDRVSSSKSSNFQNLRLGMFGLDAVPDLDETPSGILTPEARSILAIRSTLEGYAASLGISVSTMTTTALVTVDIVITTEAHFQSLRSSVGRPVIVLGGKPALHYSANRQTDGENSHVVILPQPFGPRNFHKAIEACLTRVEASSNLDQTLTTVSQPAYQTATPRKVKDERKTKVMPSIKEKLEINEKPRVKEEPPSFKEEPGFKQEPKIKVVPKVKEKLEIKEPRIKEGYYLDTPKEKQVKIRVEAAPDANDRKYPRVLVVEDNPVNLKLLAMFIKKMGLNLETATNGAEAVEIYCAAHGEFGLVFMDIQMPVMNGLEASQAIRKHEKQSCLPSTVIVALTALNSVEAKQAAMDSGVNEFMSKPISMKKIKDVINEVSTMRLERE